MHNHTSLAIPFWSLMLLAACVAANTNIWWGLLVALISAIGIGLVERHGNNA